MTLRDAVATSYRLLDTGEQAALRRLSVFANRWSVELAEEMLADEADRDPAAVVDPVPLLDRLVELGLLSVAGYRAAPVPPARRVRDFAIEQAAAGRADRHPTAARGGLSPGWRPAPRRTWSGRDSPDGRQRLDEATGDIGRRWRTPPGTTRHRAAAGRPG